MPRYIGRIAFVWTALTAFTAVAYDETPGRDAAVAHALADVDHWLDSTANGVGWRNYLHLNDLSAQIAAGSKADPARVAVVLRRLESGAAGLDRPQFVRLQKA